MFCPFPFASYLDDEEDLPSSAQNLVLAGSQRGDIFRVETEHKLIAATILSLILGLACAAWMSRLEFIEVSPDYFEGSVFADRAISVIRHRIPDPARKPRRRKPQPTERNDLEKKRPSPTPQSGKGRRSRGDPRVDITSQGILWILKSKSARPGVLGSEMLGWDFAKDLDEIIENSGGVKVGGRSRPHKRRGIADLPYGGGYSQSIGSGGIDDILGNLFQGPNVVPIRRKPPVRVRVRPTAAQGPITTGGRSRESIMRVVMQHIPGLRYAYNKRLKHKPGLRGNIVVRFAISPRGTVVECTVIRSTIDDRILESEVVRQILRWRFDPVESTENAVVEYPFAFSK